MLEFCLTDSLEKVLPTIQPRALQQTTQILFANQIWSFQIAYRCNAEKETESFFISCKEQNKGTVTLRMVELVPCHYPCHPTYDDNYLVTTPQDLPDLLRPITWCEPIQTIGAEWKSLWLTIDASQLTSGSHQLNFEIYNIRKVLQKVYSFDITVLKQALPAQNWYHTQWFHADCLADYYQVPVWSEEHWNIIDHFMASAAEHGINMLLTPVFTQPLDTAIGGERTTVQLVEIYSENDQYEFDFSKLKRWVGLCKKHGITEIEVAHLFSQWGAKFAPKILVRTKYGIEKRFGWHTEAATDAYQNFLHQFLPALKHELDQLVGLEHVWFHISDEPAENQKESYAAAKAIVADELKGCHVIDALSSFTLYKEGVVEKPVVCSNHLDPFLQNQVSGLWTYYCTAQAVEVPNRFIAMPSARNRIMGVLLYKYNIEGFLHWGFNFYNSAESIHHIDPFKDTDAGGAFPSGDPFLVYPAKNGMVWNSIRGEVLKAAWQDRKLLCLLEDKIGREKTLALLEEAAGTLTFTNYPKEVEFFEKLWETGKSYILNS